MHGPPIHHTMCQQCWYAPTSRVYGGYATSRRWAANYSAVLHACIGLPFPYRATVCFSKKEAGFYDHYNSFQVSHSARKKSETSRTLQPIALHSLLLSVRKDSAEYREAASHDFFVCCGRVQRCFTKEERVVQAAVSGVHTIHKHVWCSGVAN